MNRIITVSRTIEARTGSGIRVEIYQNGARNVPDEALTCTLDEAIELASLLHLMQYNNSILSLTGSAGPRGDS